MQYMPLRFGTEPYDEGRMIAECQTVFDRVDSRLNPRIENNCFYLENEKYGKLMQLSDFIKENGISLKNIFPPDCTVVVVDKDYYCQVRKRTILYSGCAYGANVWIMKNVYCKKRNETIDPLQSLRRELVADNQTTYQSLQPKHEALLASFSETIRFTYKSGDHAIFVNDRFITSGIQAKILKEILVTYRDKNRSEFERREFIGNKEFVSDIYNSGFNVRLDRIIECVNKACPQVKIEKYSRGRFKLISTSPITITSF
jgi:hypothetical protein